MRDGLVIELKGCADQAAAMTYAQTGMLQLATLNRRLV